MKTLVALAACIFGFAGVCHAAQIASPAIYASFSQNDALCIVYNGGSSTQTVQVRLPQVLNVQSPTGTVVK